MQNAVCSSPSLVAAIRSFYLEPKRTYTVAEVSRLFSENLAKQAFDSSDDRPKSFAPSVVLSWRDVASAVQLEVDAATLEDVLGEDAPRALPAGQLTEQITLRLPRHAIEGLQQFAREHGLANMSQVIDNQFGLGAEPIEPRWV